jgi:hypothetical protein
MRGWLTSLWRIVRWRKGISRNRDAVDAYGPTEFIRLNHGWNAEPNGPLLAVEADGSDLVLRFDLNAFLYDETFTDGELGFLRFHDCSRHRFIPINDHAWYGGQCRFSGLAPAWGEFYEVVGDFRETWAGGSWWQPGPYAGAPEGQRNFLFYFRDNAFECSARDWSFDRDARNALLRLAADPSRPA